MINYLIENKVERDSILYYSFDNSKDLENILNDYLKLSNKNILEDKIFIFFDEIQKVEDWQNKIKVYYDLYPNIKFILS
jgi:predicted AAA+ superfamily ATPase